MQRLNDNITKFWLLDRGALFPFLWQENKFIIWVEMLYPYINIENCTPMYISNLFSCQKNVKKAKGLPASIIFSYISCNQQN